jgi:hypothetical protein
MSGPLGSAQWMYASGAAVTQQSLKFNHPESQYLSWTPAAAGNRKISTFSAWVKLSLQQSSFSILGAGTSGSAYFLFGIEGDDLYWEATGGGGTRRSDMELRDPSGWYHLMFVLDTTQATANDRVKLYKNGVQVTSFSSIANPTQNADVSYLNNTGTHYIGYSPALPSTYGNGYLSDINFIDGQALDASSFGQFTNGYWEAKDYAGSYGTNGFHLTFQDDVVSEGFNAVTYRGTGASQSVSGLGLNPDLVWMKRRTADDHDLQDSVRGGGKTLMSNSTAAELNLSGSYGVNSFDADGFSLIGNGGRTNESGSSYVAWCWDAGSGSPVSNTDGSITSTVKANPSYGFSIASWTGNATAGATIGHGLSAVPELIITKRRDFTTAWHVYSQTLGNTNGLYLNDTAASTAFGPTWNSTSPTSSVFSVGDGNWINQGSMIAYCFHSVANYSSIGSYTGNGSSTGPTVTTGFPVAFVMIKRSDGTGWWAITDNTRSTVNTRSNTLAANEAYSEATLTSDLNIDFTSTGFQIKDTDAYYNASGGTYIYMAFADTREAAFWKDVSGQGNHWTPSGLDYRDSLIDSPANNFATFNPIDKNDGTYSEGNLKAVTGTVGGSTQRGSFYFNNGKWYYEFLPTINGGITALGFESLNGGVYTPHFYQADNGQYYNGASASAYGATFTTLDVIGVALDADNQTVEFFKNGASQGLISSVNSGMTAGDEYVVHLTDRDVAQTLTGVINFGQDSTFAGSRAGRRQPR